MNLANKIALFLYSQLAALAKPLLIKKLKKRAKTEKLYGEKINERFGKYDYPSIEKNNLIIWVHAVSLGETKAAGELIAKLRQKNPKIRFIITSGTATGRQEAQNLLKNNDLQTWQPWDSKAAVKKFLAHHKPDIAIIMETEIWPNLILEAKKAGVKIILANARLSAKTYKQSQKAKIILSPAYQAFNKILAQTKEDADLLKKMGGQNITIAGNLKYDAKINQEQIEQAQIFKKENPYKIIMLASSREGEEKQFINAIKKEETNKNEKIKYLIVPRHPQRFKEVEEIIKNAGYKIAKREEFNNPDKIKNAQILLGNSLGEMGYYYSISEIALLGASFENLGGQNIIEAAAYQTPIITGQYTFNFKQACENAITAGAAVRVENMNEAVDKAREIINDPAKYNQMEKATGDFIKPNLGAAEKMAEEIMMN